MIRRLPLVRPQTLCSRFWGVLLCALVLSVSGCGSEGERLYEQGKSLHQRGNRQGALEAWEKAAEALQREGEKPGRAWEKMGTALKELQRPAEAAVYFEKAIADNPLDLDRYRKLIRVLTLSHEFDKARAVRDQLQTDPKLVEQLKLRPEEAKEIQAVCDLIDAAEKAAASRAPSSSVPAPAETVETPSDEPRARGGGRRKLAFSPRLARALPFAPGRRECASG
jgi:tetratricopeptide (TPR) repeat protein